MVRFCVKEFDGNYFCVFLEVEVLPEPDEEINTLMRKHRTSIQTFYKKGKVQSIFYFLYNQDLKELIPIIVNQFLQLQFNRFKLNYSFAYILKNISNENYVITMRLTTIM